MYDVHNWFITLSNFSLLPRRIAKMEINNGNSSTIHINFRSNDAQSTTNQCTGDGERVCVCVCECVFGEKKEKMVWRTESERPI